MNPHFIVGNLAATITWVPFLSIFSLPSPAWWQVVPPAKCNVAPCASTLPPSAARPAQPLGWRAQKARNVWRMAAHAVCLVLQLCCF